MVHEKITQQIQAYIDNNEIAGCSLIIRKDGQIVYDKCFGYANAKEQLATTDATIYRMASMTKCIIGTAYMKLLENGVINLDDPVSKYLPDFANLRVANDSRYTFPPKKLTLLMIPFFKMEKVKSIPANREITLRDLLSHASGLEQGVAGMIGMMRLRSTEDTLKERVEKYSKFVLDFQPGTSTSYSPCAAFDILGYILEVISGKNTEDFLRDFLFNPLEMYDTTFLPTEEQLSRMARCYKPKDGSLVDVTWGKEDLIGLLKPGKNRFVAGCGGLYSTVKDYEHLADMLCNNGTYKGLQFLKPETVSLMATEAQAQHLEPEPGFTWGLSVKIRQDTSRTGTNATEGTFGWSGALGTHFFVSPKDRLEAVFATNRADAGGSGFYISSKIEEMIFDIWKDK